MISRDIKVEDHIGVDEYCKIRRASGLSSKSKEAAEIGLLNSIHSVALRNSNNSLIGMGRLIGDGGCFCQIVDICVIPEYQGNGLGKAIVSNLLGFVKAELPESCYVSLFADGKASLLYEQYGFRDTLPKSKGMFLKL